MPGVNYLQITGSDDIAVNQGFPIDGLPIDQSPQTGARVFKEVSSLPSLEPEVHRGKPKGSGYWNGIGGIRTHAEVPFRKEESVPQGCAEFGHLDVN